MKIVIDGLQVLNEEFNVVHFEILADFFDLFEIQWFEFEELIIVDSVVPASNDRVLDCNAVFFTFIRVLEVVVNLEETFLSSFQGLAGESMQLGSIAGILFVLLG